MVRDTPEHVGQAGLKKKNLCEYIYIYIYIYTHTYIYIYVYIERMVGVLKR